MKSILQEIQNVNKRCFLVNVASDADHSRSLVIKASLSNMPDNTVFKNMFLFEKKILFGLLSVNKDPKLIMTILIMRMTMTVFEIKEP